MKEILLSTEGYTALVDDEDYDRVIKYKWSIAGLRPLYVRSYKIGYLHRFIMNAKDGEYVDHKNHNGLDCRKENLRLCSLGDNQGNRLKGKNNRSGFKGVYYLATGNRKRPWRAQIQKNDKLTVIGYFLTPEEAARAYDKVAKELHGEYAKTNYED